jgi:hypothetical protein
LTNARPPRMKVGTPTPKFVRRLVGCRIVNKNRIPCTIVLETHRCYDQCIKYGNIAFLGRGSGDARTRSKGVGALLRGEGIRGSANALQRRQSRFCVTRVLPG